MVLTTVGLPRGSEGAVAVLRVLAAAGKESYIVGGAVRDYLLGQEPVDFDIATSARPDEIAALAAAAGWSTHAVGAAFGTIVVVAAGKAYEVTTFREERYGEDSHRPSEVRFGTDLATDLARRDLTINAMCLTAEGQLIDVYDGRRDLAEKRIRMVGCAADRFAEDGLRMFRAIRFAARLGFTLADDIVPAIRANLARVAGLSVERVYQELTQTLLTQDPARGFQLLREAGLLTAACQARQGGSLAVVPILPELAALAGIPQNPRYHRYDVWGHTLAVTAAIEPTPLLRWTALLHDIAKGSPGIRGRKADGSITDYGHERQGAAVAAAILRRLRADKALIAAAEWLIYHHMQRLNPDARSVVRWLKKRSSDYKSSSQLTAAVENWLRLLAADKDGKGIGAGAAEVAPLAAVVREVLAAVPFYPQQLAVSGGQIAAEIGSGPQVLALQQDWLRRIQAGQLENSREALIAALMAKKRRCSPYLPE